MFLCNIGYELIEPPLESRLGVIVYGAFADENSNTTNFLYIRVQLLHTQTDDYEYEDEADGNYSISYIESDDNIFRLPITENIKDIDTATEVRRAHTFYLDEKMFDQIPQNDTVLRLSIESNLPVSLPINLAYDPTPINKERGVIYAAIVLLGLYVMIIWEVVHRTFGKYHFDFFISILLLRTHHSWCGTSIFANNVQKCIFSLWFHSPNSCNNCINNGHRNPCAYERTSHDARNYVVDRRWDSAAAVRNDDIGGNLIWDGHFRLFGGLRIQGNECRLFRFMLGVHFNINLIFAT